MKSQLDLNKTQTTYPYIRYPTKVQDYLNSEFVELRKLPRPQKKVLKEYDYTGYLISILCIVIFITLIYFKVTFWIAYVALVILSYWWFNSSYVFNAHSRKVNREINSLYQEDLLSVQIENDKRQKLENSLFSKNKLEDFKKIKIKEVFKNYTQPELVDCQTKKGLSESFFIKFLFKYFGNNIKPFSTLYGNSFSYEYQPDFVFQNENICIDIEIDEPYIMETRTPIHSSDENFNHTRDNFFINNNWCVLRFSEEQVLLYPYECCNYIAHMIFELTGDNQFLEYLKFRTFPSNTNRWTKSEAEKMEIDKHRELIYLKANHNASQIEYFPQNFFNDDGIILITKVSKGKDNEHICLNNNFHGPKKLFIANHFFSNLKFGDTIELNLNQFILEETFIEYRFPTSGDPSCLTFETHKERITRINEVKT